MSSANAVSTQLDVTEVKLEASPKISYNTYMSKYLNVSDIVIKFIPQVLMKDRYNV